MSVQEIEKKMRKFRRHIAWGVALVVGTALVMLFSFYVLAPALVGAAPQGPAAVRASVSHAAAPVDLAWDPRLDELNVTLMPASDCLGGCWRLVEARYEDPDQSGGLHHIWSRVLDADGQQLAGHPWTVAWPEGSAALQTKPYPDQADFPMYASYAPDREESGPYRASAGADESRSDTVWGMGLPLKHHVNFRLVWQWTIEAPTPLPTHTPQPTPTPESLNLPLCGYLPVMIQE